MDQDAFRNLLASGSSSHTRPSVTINDYKRKNKKEVEPDSGPSFKPRNHKKPVETYRDRATERRGGANDFADVEKVLADFERVNANTDAVMIEEQRKMLGGDEKHTVLVKGLDFALLEQQKAKLYETQDAQDEMALEEVFQELSAPKKRTREELVAGLKKTRSEGIPVDKPLEIAKQQGKFKPIGAPADTKLKKRKAKGDEKDGEKKKKKKRKLEDAANEVLEGGSNPPPEESLPKPRAKPRTPSPEIDPDADIFGEAEEYHGLPFGSDSEGEGEEPQAKAQASTSTRAPPAADSASRKDWFGEKTEVEAPINPASQPRRPATPEDQHMVSVPEEGKEEAEEQRPRTVVRLQALASSAVPSVREILAIDEAAEREEKRKAKKEKRNKKKNPSEETKINREVKQLEKYVAAKPK